MSFAPLLREIVENCGGGIAIALMQSDGIPIEELTLDAEALPDGIETAAAEFGRILDEIRKASDAIGGGASPSAATRRTVRATPRGTRRSPAPTKSPTLPSPGAGLRLP